MVNNFLPLEISHRLIIFLDPATIIFPSGLAHSEYTEFLFPGNVLSISPLSVSQIIISLRIDEPEIILSPDLFNVS
jgi:hypothetical protein